MPELNPFLALLPAPEYLFPIQLSVEVDEPRFEPLEHAPDLLELEHEVVDLARDVVDAAPERELVGRFAPFGSSLRRHEFVLRHEITSATTRLTKGRVRLSSARVKYLRGTAQI